MELTDIVLIIVVAVVLFGPERIPQFSRKAARLVVALRDIANNAQTQLREELGPEYADLQINDLNPKNLVRKHLSSEIAALEEARSELTGAVNQAKDSTKEVESAVKSAKTAVKEKPALPATLKFDLEAT